MSSLNKAMIIGNLGKDPETKYLPSGDAVTNISVATSTRWKDKASGEDREETEWHRVSLFGRIAEVAGEYLTKGSKVYIEGRIKTRKWQDRDGNDRYSTEIVGERLVMLGDRNSRHGEGNDYTRGNSERTGTRSAPPKQPSGKFDDLEDDIPF